MGRHPPGCHLPYLWGRQIITPDTGYERNGVTEGRREGSLLVTRDGGLPSFQSTFGAVTPRSLLLSAFLSFPGGP